MKHSVQSKSNTRAYSLVEMLAVLGIIAIAMGFLTVRLLPPSSNEAAKVAAGMLQAARSEAITAGRAARVAICIDSSSETGNLRRIVNLLSVDQTNAGTTTPADPDTTQWQITSIRNFPQGTSFQPKFSNVTPIFNLETEGPLRSQSGLTGDQFTYIEFDAVGHCESSSQWAFTRADFDDATPAFPNEMDRVGFIVRKTGKVTWFTTPEQIQTPQGNP